jgi:hypothetical protein
VRLSDFLQTACLTVELYIVLFVTASVKYREAEVCSSGILMSRNCLYP